MPEKGGLKAASIFFLVVLLVSPPLAQNRDSELNIFGYFQNSFQHWSGSANQSEQNSFSLQQLNLFLQKDLGSDWTAFVNFEVLNNFSSGRRWGSFNLEEAWLKYRVDMKFNLKLGLQIPTFNNLNEIKNRTPLLPYIVRPVVYETSFGEFLPIDNFVPARAFVQAYGFLPSGETKLDYAVYVGNGPNINDNPARGQTGVDTTATFLVGGRLGIRFRDLKLGLSATYEKRNDFVKFAEPLGRASSDLEKLPTTRFGGDLSYNYAGFSFESEFITVNVDEGIPDSRLDLDFYYATLGRHFTEAFYGYGSYWIIKSHFSLLGPAAELIEDEDVRVATFGLAYDLNERVRFKGQFARVSVRDERRFFAEGMLPEGPDKFTIYALAASVFF